MTVDFFLPPGLAKGSRGSLNVGAELREDVRLIAVPDVLDAEEQGNRLLARCIRSGGNVAARPDPAELQASTADRSPPDLLRLWGTSVSARSSPGPASAAAGASAPEVLKRFFAP
jgi:hypothetical protein